MSGCMIICRSVTYAQRVRNLLLKYGISAAVVRPSLEMTGNSCGYAAKISEGYLAEALDLLKKNGFVITRVLFVKPNGDFREMSV